MTLFWLFAAGLIVLALVVVLPVLLSPREGNARQAADTKAAKVEYNANRANNANLSILRDQLTQLDAELAEGSISTAQYRETRAEIERRALEEGVADEKSTKPPAPGKPTGANRRLGTAVLVGLSVPVLALGLYGFLGNPQALVAASGLQSTDGRPESSAQGDDMMAAQIEAMVAQLADRLEKQPTTEPADPQAWAMLARSYAALQRFPDADRAYARATQLAPDNAQLLADHADVLAMLQGQSAAGAPTRLIERALKLDPKNLKALALAGSAAFERQDFLLAVQYWQQARTLAPPESDFARGIDRSLDEARLAANAQPNSAVPTKTATSPPAELDRMVSQDKALNVGGVRGTLSMDPKLASQVRPDDTVFIFARAAQGPRMPLAILRRKASDLPLSFTLDDSTAMSPEMKLSKFPQIVVGARISRSGNAMPQSGDLVGQAGPIKTGTAQLAITIDSVQP